MESKPPLIAKEQEQEKTIHSKFIVMASSSIPNYNSLALEWFTKILKGNYDDNLVEKNDIILGISGILKCRGIFNLMFFKEEEIIDRHLANLCPADANQNCINIQSALVYNSSSTFDKLKNVSNLHIGRSTEIEELNDRVKKAAAPQIENLVDTGAGENCIMLLVTATRFEDKWIEKFNYEGERPFHKNSSQSIDLHYYSGYSQSNEQFFYRKANKQGNKMTFITNITVRNLE